MTIRENPLDLIRFARSIVLARMCMYY